MKAHVLIPGMRLESLANKREHWTKKAARAKTQRRAAHMELWGCGAQLPPLAGIKRINVEITRIAPRALDDDNLAISCKHVRDGIADWAKCDDGHSVWKWTCSQRKGLPKQYAVEILIQVEV